MSNVCKFDLDSFQSDFLRLIEPLWDDSLTVTDSKGNKLPITDNIRRLYLNNVISYIGGLYSDIKHNYTNAINIIKEAQEDCLDESLHLDDNAIKIALNTSNIKSEDLLYKDYSTATIEKYDDKTEYRNTFTNKYLVTFFGKCMAALNYCKRTSTQTVIDSCILHTITNPDGTKVNTIVKSDEELNQYIRETLEKLFSNIISYLKMRFKGNDERLHQLSALSTLYSGDFSLYLGTMEKLNEQFADVLNVDSFNSEYLNILFLNYSQARGITKKIYQTEIDGYNSWVMLNNFDSVLRNTFGASIFINNNLPTFSGKNKLGRLDTLKYSLSKAKASNMNLTWRTSEDINISDEISNLVQLLITNVKYLGTDKNIKFNEFGYIIGKLKDLIFKLDTNTTTQKRFSQYMYVNKTDGTLDYIQSLVSEKTWNLIKDKTFLELLSTYRDSAQDYLPAIFEVLANDNIRDIIQQSISLNNRLSEFDINLIKSLYSGLFDSNNPQSLLYANDNNGYDTQNYLSYITLVGDAITNAQYIQYFKDIDGNIYLRNMYDQTLDNILRTIELSIVSVNTNRIIDFDLVSKNLDIIPTVDKDNKLLSIKYKIDDNLYVIVPTVGKLSVVDSTNKVVNITPEIHDKILDLAESVLKLGIDHTDLWDTFVMNSANNSLAAISDMLELTSSALLNQYISNKILVTETGEHIKDSGRVLEMLELIYGDDKLRMPKFFKRLGEIYLTSSNNLPILQKLALSKAIVEGRLTSSQIKDGNGNSVPNTTLSRLLGNVLLQYALQGTMPNSVIKNFSLYKNGVIKGIYLAKEFKNSVKTSSTAHTEFTPAETEQSEIIYDFLQGMESKPGTSTSPIGNGVIALLPSDNSDKSYIGRIVIDLNRITYADPNSKMLTTLKYALWDYRNNKPKPEADNILNLLLFKEFGQSGYGYFSRIKLNLNTLYNRINIAILEYLYNSNELPYQGLVIDYANSEFDTINSIYLNNPGIAQPAVFLNNVIRQWNNNHPNDIITLTEHSTYEVDKKTKLLMPNINLNYLYNTFSNPDNVAKYFKTQNKLILTDLLNDGFKVNGLNIGTLNIQGTDITVNSSEDIYSNLDVINERLYTHFSLASSITSIMNTLNDDITVTFELNPTINLYNKLNYLFTLEWMASTVGGHYNHPAKVKIDNTLFRTTPLSDIEKKAFGRNNTGKMAVMDTIQLALLYRLVNYNIPEFITLASLTQKQSRTRKKETFSEELILRYLANRQQAEMMDEAGRFNSQNKRNVSFTAAMHPYLKNVLQGTPSIANICIIKDNNARIATVTGVDTKVPTSDGATYINPLMTYWENGALGAAKVGINKKQFVHFYDETTGTGGIIKTAGFAMTNELMQTSVFLRRMTLMMLDHVWRDLKGNEITDWNITRDYNGNDILLTNTNDIDGSFYVKSNGKYYKFLSLNYKGDNIYTRTVQEIDPEHLTTINLPIELDINGNEITEETDISTLPKINSNYRLWLMLGGYECYEQKSGMDKLTHSEYSIKAAADIANRVGEKLTEGLIRTQLDLYQFMKHSDIHYMPTEGAVKQGAANSEDINIYLKGLKDIGDFKPNFMKIHMNLVGILLDKEHNADLEDLSIFTQVLSACASRGYTQDLALNMYNALAILAHNAVNNYLTPFEKYLENPQLYKDGFQQSISELIAKALMTETNSSDVLNYIASNLIELSNKGEKFKFKDSIPFSDSSVYNKLISTISTTLTKAAIKIKMPGLLAVLCPSYDIIKLHGNEFRNFTDEELSELQDTYNNNPNYTIEKGWINLPELCRTYTLTLNSDTSILDIIEQGGRLNADGTIDFLIEVPAQRLYLKELVGTGVVQTVVENVKEGRNLAPYDVYFKDSEGNQYSLYDCDIIKLRFIDKDSVPDESVLEVLNALSPTYTDNVVTIDGRLIMVDKSSIEIKPYELVLPKVFATNFDLDFDSNLNDIVQDRNYFTRKLLNKLSQNIDNKYFNIAFTKMSGEPIYVLDRKSAKTSLNFYRIDVPTTVDNKGNVSTINANYEVEYTLSKNQNDIDNNPELTQDEIWQYVDEAGYAHKVIVTDDLAYHINNILSNGIRLSELNNTDEQLLLKSNNRLVKLWYNSIKHISKDTFRKNIHKFNNLLNRAAESDTNIYNLVSHTPVLNIVRKEGNKIWTSFNKSLELVAARIPAQSMLSFMAMKIVGFVDSDVNTAYVSTLQTYLQGSDYTFLFSDENANYL